MRFGYYVLTVVYCAGLFWLSSQSQPLEPIDLPDLDKVAHFILYGGLAAIVSVGLRRSPDATPPVVQFFVPAAFAITYGLTDELHQYFVPDRSFDPFDLIADAFGALTVQAALCFGLWKIPRRAVLGKP